MLWFASVVSYHGMHVYVLICFFCRWEEGSKTRRIIKRKSRASSSRLFKSIWFYFYAKFAQCMPLFVHKEPVMHAEFPYDCCNTGMCAQSVHQCIIIVVLHDSAICIHSCTLAYLNLCFHSFHVMDSLQVASKPIFVMCRIHLLRRWQIKLQGILHSTRWLSSYRKVLRVLENRECLLWTLNSTWKQCKRSWKTPSLWRWLSVWGMLLCRYHILFPTSPRGLPWFP